MCPMQSIVIQLTVGCEVLDNIGEYIPWLVVLPRVRYLYHTLVLKNHEGLGKVNRSCMAYLVCLLTFQALHGSCNFLGQRYYTFIPKGRKRGWVLIACTTANTSAPILHPWNQEEPGFEGIWKQETREQSHEIVNVGQGSPLLLVQFWEGNIGNHA